MYTDDTKARVGTKVRELRTKNKISQSELGKRVNKSHAAVSDIELGKTDLSVTDLSALANALGVTVEYLLDKSQNSFGVSFSQNRFSKDASQIDKSEAKRAIDDFERMVDDMAKTDL